MRHSQANDQARDTHLEGSNAGAVDSWRETARSSTSGFRWTARRYMSRGPAPGFAMVARMNGTPLEYPTMTAPSPPISSAAGLTLERPSIFLATGAVAPSGVVRGISSSTLVSRTFSTPRQTTHYIECGPADGPLMIFLHGWPSIGLMWRAQMDAFAADGWHCVAPDLRGYGGSSAPAANDAYTIEDVVADMAELHDHLGGKPAIWVGHDWGCVVAGALVAHEPKRSRGVVLTSLAYHPDANALPRSSRWSTGRSIRLTSIRMANGTTTATTRRISRRQSPTSMRTRRHRWRRSSGQATPPPSARFAERGGHAQRRALRRRAPRPADPT